MKSFGIKSELDEAGGVKIPDMLFGLHGVAAGDTMEMHLEGQNIVMKKYPPTCIFCGSAKDIREYRNRSFCCCCADELRNY